MATAYGPNGMNKMVINHLEKLFVTNDAATIIRELEVEHPAAKMMILGSQMMEQEVHKLDIFDKTRQFWTNYNKRLILQ